MAKKASRGRSLRGRNGASSFVVVIDCNVALGLFNGERTVKLSLPDRTLSAVVARGDVIVQKDPAPGEEVPGALKVTVLEMKGNRAVIDLPKPTFTEGSRIAVPQNRLQRRASAG